MDTKALNLKSAGISGKLLLFVLIGMIAGNFAIKADKKGGWIFPIGITGAGLVANMMFKQEMVKMAGLGLASIGAIKTLNKAGSLEGLGSLGIAIPENIRNMINKIIPQLGEVSDYDSSIDVTRLGEMVELPELIPASFSGLGDGAFVGDPNMEDNLS